MRLHELLTDIDAGCEPAHEAGHHRRAQDGDGGRRSRIRGGVVTWSVILATLQEAYEEGGLNDDTSGTAELISFIPDYSRAAESHAG